MNEHVRECCHHLSDLGIGLPSGAQELSPDEFVPRLRVALHTLNAAGLRLHHPSMTEAQVKRAAAGDDQDRDGVDVAYHGKPDESYTHHLSAADGENDWIAEAAARVSAPAKDSAPAADEDWIGELARKASDKQ